MIVSILEDEFPRVDNARRLWIVKILEQYLRDAEKQIPTVFSPSNGKRIWAQTTPKILLFTPAISKVCCSARSAAAVDQSAVRDFGASANHDRAGQWCQMFEIWNENFDDSGAQYGKTI